MIKTVIISAVRLLLRAVAVLLALVLFMGWSAGRAHAATPKIPKITSEFGAVSIASQTSQTIQVWGTGFDLAPYNALNLVAPVTGAQGTIETPLVNVRSDSTNASGVVVYPSDQLLAPLAMKLRAGWGLVKAVNEDGSYATWPLYFYDPAKTQGWVTLSASTFRLGDVVQEVFHAPFGREDHVCQTDVADAKDVSVQSWWDDVPPGGAPLSSELSLPKVQPGKYRLLIDCGTGVFGTSFTIQAVPRYEPVNVPPPDTKPSKARSTTARPVAGNGVKASVAKKPKGLATKTTVSVVRLAQPVNAPQDGYGTFVRVTVQVTTRGLPVRGAVRVSYDTLGGGYLLEKLNKSGTVTLTSAGWTKGAHWVTVRTALGAKYLPSSATKRFVIPSGPRAIPGFK